MNVAVELATNAVRHTASGSGGRFVVEVTQWMRMTRVAVYDAGSLKSPRVTENLLSEDGRGLLMVNAPSARMGVGGNARGRVVWADIPWTESERPYNGVTYAPEIPPSTRNVEAVMNEASSLARNTTADAISSGSANRPIGTCTSRR